MSDRQLREAFNKITPDEKTKQAMLANILAAAATAVPPEAAAPAAPAAPAAMATPPGAPEAAATTAAIAMATPLGAAAPAAPAAMATPPGAVATVTPSTMATPSGAAAPATTAATVVPLDAAAAPVAVKRHRRSRLFDVALPIAACLVLLAGVGALVLPELFSGAVQNSANMTLEPLVPSAPTDAVPPTNAPAAETPMEATPSFELPSDSQPMLAVPSSARELPIAWPPLIAIGVALLTLAIWAALKLVRRKKDR